jgi:predicted transcriptional regulator
MEDLVGNSFHIVRKEEREPFTILQQGRPPKNSGPIEPRRFEIRVVQLGYSSPGTEEPVNGTVVIPADRMDDIINLSDAAPSQKEQEVLRLFSCQNYQPLHRKTIQQTLNVSQPTVTRVLGLLLDRGLLRQIGDRKPYELTPEGVREAETLARKV